MQGEALSSTPAFGTGRDQAAEPEAWRAFAQAERIEDFARAWIALVCRSADGVSRAALLLGPGESGPFELVARHPELAAVDTLAADAAAVLTAAVEKRRPAVETADRAATRVGYPLVFDGVLRGALLMETRPLDDSAARRLLRHIQWSAPALDAFLARDAARSGAQWAERAQFLVGTIDAVALEERGSDAARVLADALARRLSCDSVAIGRWTRRRARLHVMSQTASIDRRGAVAHAIEAAQEEAVDQETAVLAPRNGANPSFVTVAHDRLSRLCMDAHVLTVPLFAGAEPVGAITARRASGPFTQEHVDIADALATGAAPLLVDKWRLDRPVVVLAGERALGVLRKIVGPRHFALKFVVVALLAAAAALAFGTQDYRVRARAKIEGETRRLVAAPFDGYIRAQYVRAGDVVQEGAPLADLQDSDLVLERLRQIARKRQSQLELDKALAKRDLAETNISRAQIEQTNAEIDLSDQMIERAKLRAPFAAVVVSGDLSQSVGKPVSRGDALFELAPLDRYRITAVVPESEVRLVRPGQAGELLLSSLPDRAFPFTVESVTPVAQASDGVNGFEAIGVIDLKDAGKEAGLRPGMEGVAKIEAGRRNLAWVWLHPVMDWLRIKAWAWIP